MKTKLLLIATTVALLLVMMYDAKANDALEEAMLNGIKQINEAKSVQDLKNAVNVFERIAQAAPEHWEPYYFAGLANINMANYTDDMEAKDNHWDEALKQIGKGLERAPMDSELIALQGYCYMLKVSVDPASRGQSMSPKAIGAFHKALAINPANPRATLMLGQMELGMAQFFGTGPEKGCGLIKKSVDLFDGFEKSTPYAPDWGIEWAKSAVKSCQ